MSVFAAVLVLASLFYGIISAVELLLQRRRNQVQQRLFSRLEHLSAQEHVMHDAHELLYCTLFARCSAMGKLLVVNARPNYTEEWSFDISALQSLVIRTEPDAGGKPERIYLDIRQRQVLGIQTLLLFESCGTDRETIRKVHASAWTWEATLRSLLDGFPQPVPMVQTEVQETQLPVAVIPAV